MERVWLGGVEQSVWFRGLDVTRPVLVLLHGGPGASESALFRHYNAELERHFLVVYWEQRGSGRSFHATLACTSMTVERLLQDLDELIDLVQRRYGRGRVVLLGHSWGTVLGTLYAYSRPDKVAAYVGTGQIASKREADRVGHRYALAQARARGNARAIAELEAIDPERPSVDDIFTLDRWIERFDGTFRAGLSTGRLILAALSTDEADMHDLILFGRGNRFSHECLLGEFREIDLTSKRRFEVPVFFMLGRHDQVTPSTLAQAYFESIEAPYKRLVWFDQSAHNVPFEQPDEFNRVLVEEVLPIIHSREAR
jgi:pimeloyl-ACP methyl ester carboxylesterase